MEENTWFNANILPETLKAQGYSLEPRGSNDTDQREGKERLIIIWRKGYENPGFHFKCDGQAPDGQWFEGVGDTPEKALESWAISAGLK